MPKRDLVVACKAEDLRHIDRTLFSLDRTYDQAGSLADARGFIRKGTRYGCILMDVLMAARLADADPSISVSDSFLDEVDEIHGLDNVAIVAMVEPLARHVKHGAGMLRELTPIIRKAGILEFVDKPFAVFDSSLASVMKKALATRILRSHGPTREMLRDQPTWMTNLLLGGATWEDASSGIAAACTAGSLDSERTAWPTLTATHREILEVLAHTPHQTMVIVDLTEATEYRRHAVAAAIRELLEAGLVHRPRGQRKGVAITPRGLAYLETPTNAGAKSAPCQQLH